MKLDPRSQVRATPEQRNYIEILCNDVGFVDREQRNSWISLEIGRKLRYLDELAKSEASDLIKRLREIKTGQSIA